MLYDTRIRIRYDYERWVAGGRNIVRILPASGAGQRLVAGTIAIEPQPAERGDGRDFFGNPVAHIAMRGGHQRLELVMQARVKVDRAPWGADRSAAIASVADEARTVLSLAPDAPHHYLGASPQAAPVAEIADWARDVTRAAASAREAVEALGRRIHDEFAYDPDATEVDTPPREAFALRKGVCQDFSHIMIVGLRALGIPAGYVSGVIRTIPPKGQARLEGADAMHAWVQAWCGLAEGWVEYDPTNAVPAGNDHVVVARGRDYGDVAPLTGVVKTAGGQRTDQFVDVIPLS